MAGAACAASSASERAKRVGAAVKRGARGGARRARGDTATTWSAARHNARPHRPRRFSIFSKAAGHFFCAQFCARRAGWGRSSAAPPKERGACLRDARRLPQGFLATTIMKKQRAPPKETAALRKSQQTTRGAQAPRPNTCQEKKQRASYPGALRAQRLAMRRERCGRPRPSCALAAEVCDRHKATPYKRLRRQLRREAVFVASCAGRGACAGRRAAGREKAPAAVAARAGDQNGSSSIVGRCARSLTRRSASRLNFRRAAAWSSLRGAVFASAKASSAPS